MENVPQNKPAQQRWRTVIWLLVLQVIGCLPLIPWVVAAPLSFMAFDSGVSNEATLFVGAVWCYPALPLGAALLAWILFALKKDRAALVVTSLPLLIVLPILAFIAYLGLGGN